MTESKPLPGSVKTFACPSCGGTVNIRAVGITISAVCQSCHSIIDVANDNLNIIAHAAAKTHPSAIPLGARGTLFGVAWEVIGYSEKSDETEQYKWREYLLFNPYQGFRFLVEDRGHWTFVKMLRHHIKGAGTAGSVALHDRIYKIFTRGEAIVQYVMGEFYWRVKVGEKTRIADYICPPFMLSMEESDGDIIWSQGKYIDSNIIQHAFPEAVMPMYQRGIAPNQPAPGEEGFKVLKQLTVGFVAALFVLQVIFSSLAGKQVIYERTVHAEPAYKNQIILADPLDVPGGPGNLEFTAYSPVNNNWVELNMSLVNSATQESDDFIQSVEYYHGRDIDGPWSEGGQVTKGILSAVRAGQYKLLVEPDAGAFHRGETVDFALRVTRNVPMWENFWIAVLLLMAYPSFVMMRRWNFETQRWSTSDYAPAIYKRKN